MKNYKELIKQCKTKEEVDWFGRIIKTALAIRQQKTIRDRSKI